MNKVIAVVGMSGSGKSVATETLEKQGWHKIYLGGITYQKMKEAGITITPDSEKVFREDLRKKHGPECYARFILPEIEKVTRTNDIVLDGLYSWYEYKFLEEHLKENLKVICIVTDKNLRYERIANRPERPFNYQKVKERDISEIENLYKGGPIAYADYYIINNGTLEEYKKRLDEIIKQI